MSGRKLPGDLITTHLEKGQSIHQLQFLTLASRMQHFDLAVSWLADILRHDDHITKDIIRKVLGSRTENTYLGFLNDQPVAMMGTRDYRVDDSLSAHFPPSKWLFGVYIDLPYRGLDFFSQIMQHLRFVGLRAGARFVLFDCITQRNVSLYQRAGAQVLHQEMPSSFFVLDLARNLKNLSKEEIQLLICLSVCQIYPNRSMAMLEEKAVCFFTMLTYRKQNATKLTISL